MVSGAAVAAPSTLHPHGLQGPRPSLLGPRASPRGTCRSASCASRRPSLRFRSASCTPPLPSSVSCVSPEGVGFPNKQAGRGGGAGRGRGAGRRADVCSRLFERGAVDVLLETLSHPYDGEEKSCTRTVLDRAGRYWTGSNPTP